jgi:hypothetical protein
LAAHSREDPLKTLADELADRFARGETDAFAQLASLAAKSPPAAAPERGWSSHIGIWRPDPQEDGSYERIDGLPGAELSLWADRERIESKGQKTRVILLGESVARGLLFDPAYTPAQVLEQLLSAHVASGVEVLDLARTGLTADGLVDLLQQVPALKPDALVIFAGNNWARGHLNWVVEDPSERKEAAAILRQEGMRALKTHLEQKFAASVGELIRGLPLLAEELDLPVVVLVPEFNLAEWEEDASAGPPWLADGNRAWWEL